MKKILIALALSAFATTGAQAQTCTTTTKTVTKTTTIKPAVKHKAAVKHTTPAQATGNGNDMCTVVPYNVYKIQPDRKTVVGYQTTDLENLTPMNNNVTYYGNKGQMPDHAKKLPANTVVLKGKPKSQHCKSDPAKKETTCFLKGNNMNRDAQGRYSY